jgi:hypothetical protein
LPRVRGELGHSGTFGHVAVAAKIAPDRAAQVLNEVRGGLPQHVLGFGHQPLQTPSGEPYTQFTFVATKAGNPKIEDVIGGIAERIVTILAGGVDNLQVEMDPTVYATGRSQPLFRERLPVRPAETQAPAAGDAPQAPANGTAPAPAPTHGAPEPQGQPNGAAAAPQVSANGAGEQQARTTGPADLALEQ